jgi:hypothetical protein
MPDLIAAQSFRILPKREVLDNLVDSIMCLQRQKWLENLSRLEAPCVAFVSRMFVVLVKCFCIGVYMEGLLTVKHSKS